jgi:RNase P subunit RPR2
MLETLRRTSRLCKKCERPMTWQLDQEVQTRLGRELMQVFKCEHCDRLVAHPVVHTD